MKLNLQLILRHLKCQKPLLSEHDSMHGELKNVYLYAREENCSEDYVYLMHASDIPSLRNQDASRRFHFVIQYDSEGVGEIEYEELPQNWDYLSITASWELEKTLQMIQQIFEQYQQWERQLTKSILESHPLQEQMDLAVQYLPNPIAFFDPSFSLLGYAGHIPEEFNDPIWNTVIHMQFASVDNLTPEYLQFYSANSHLQELLVYPDFNQPSDNRIISATFRRDGRDFAIMAMDELCATYEPCDFLLLETVYDKLRYSSRLMEATGSESGRESKLFMNLMEGHNITEAMMRRLVQLNHWSEKSWFTVVCMERLREANTLTDENAFSVMNRIRKAEPELKMYYRQGRIIGLMVSREEEANLTALSVICNTLGMITGISMSYRGWKHLPEARAQAEIAVSYFENRQNIRTSDSQEKYSVYYRDIYPYHLLKCIANDGSLGYCVHPALWQLYDAGRTELLRTLQVYLRTGKQLSETARILGMHRNSVSYRLQCAEDILGIQLASATWKELWFMELSCEILSYGIVDMAQLQVMPEKAKGTATKMSKSF